MRLWPQSKHRHDFGVWREVYGGAACTMKIGTCGCGETLEEITGAGYQQLGWWADLGVSGEEAMAALRAGISPLVSTDHGWDLIDTRPVHARLSA